MLNGKPYYFNIYLFLSKLSLLLICVFLLACNEQNNTKQILSTEKQFQTSESAININLASAAELEKLPHIGKQKAQEIINYREKFGRFRKPEHLMLVRGISDKRFRAMKNLIKAE